MSHYLDRAVEGDSRFSRYVQGSLLVSLFWQILGFVAIAILLPLVHPPGTAARDIFDVYDEGIRGSALDLAILLVPMSLLGFLGLRVAARRLHRRPFLSIATGEARLSWRRIFLGFWLWGGLLALSTLVQYMLEPAAFEFVLEPRRFLPYLAVGIIAIPLQASFEEFLFRGYGMQAIRVLTPRPWIILGAPALFFMTLHLVNPEAVEAPFAATVAYTAVGLLLGWWSLRDGTIELAIGAHVSGNLFGLLLVGYKSSIFQTPTVFYWNEFRPWVSIFEIVVSGALFTGIVAWLDRRKRRHATAMSLGDSSPAATVPDPTSGV